MGDKEEGSTHQRATPSAKPTKDPPNPARGITGAISTMPILGDVNMRLGFGRMDSDYFTQDVIFNIDALNRVAIATYQQLLELATTDPPITQDEFVRMWKTILLVRVMNIQESEKGMRPQHFVRLAPTLSIPRPLADLIYNLGQFHSAVTGVVYDIICPQQPAVPPNWWNVDAHIVGNWELFLRRMGNYYTMTEMPRKYDYVGSPIVLAFPHAQGPMTEVKAYTNEPQMSDGFLRFVHEPEMFLNLPFNFDNCHLRMTESLFTEAVIRRYVGSYTMGSQ